MKKELLKKIAAFVGASSQHLQKVASYESDANAAGIEQAVSTLVDVGVINPIHKQASIAAAKTDPTQVVQMLKTAANALQQVSEAGSVSTMTPSAEDGLDKNAAFDRKLLGLDEPGFTSIKFS